MKGATDHQTRPSPTLEDVARRAGVSTATVSRCLNSPEKVIEATRQRVMEAVELLGYAPNFGARAMAVRRTNTIGAVIPTMENAIFARGLQAFQEGLQERGYQLLVASSSYREDLEERQIRSLVARGADGLLLIGHDRSKSAMSFLKQRRLPTLVAWTYSKSGRMPSVGFDNQSAMRALAETAIGLGHRKIAVISAPTKSNDRARDRVQGIRDAMENAGLSAGDLRLEEAVYGIDTGGAAFEKLWMSAPRPTLVMCGNDVLAVGAVKRAKALGLAVPQDVSITGFDDIELATVIEPALTTVHVPHRAMGINAAEILIGMVEADVLTPSVELDTHLQIRESLAPPRRGG